MDQNKDKPSIIIVLGMHRSGTSLVAQLIAKWGAYMGDDLIPSNQNNKDGYWEYNPLVIFNNKMLTYTNTNWYNPPESIDVQSLEKNFGDEARRLVKQMDQFNSTWCWKDPRIVFLLPFWKKILDDRRIIYIVSFRNPLSVADSLEKRDSIPHDVAMALWEVTSNKILQEIYSTDKIIIGYESLISDPIYQCERLYNFLNRELNEHKGKSELVEMRTSVKPFLASTLFKKSALSQSHMQLFEILEKGEISTPNTTIQTSPYDPWEILKLFSRSNSYKGHYQFFIQTGTTGFNEKDSIIEKYNHDISVIEINLASYNEINFIRFDPLNDWVVLKINTIELYATTEKIEKIEFSSNAFITNNNLLIFNNSDPIIIFDVRPFKNLKINKLTLSVEYIATGNEAKVYFSNNYDQFTSSLFNITGLEQPDIHSFDSLKNSIRCRVEEDDAKLKEKTFLIGIQNESIAEKNRIISINTRSIEELNQQKIEQYEIINGLNQSIEEQRLLIEKHLKENNVFKETLSDKINEINKYKILIKNINLQLSQNEELINEIQIQLQKKEELIHDFKLQITENEKQIDEIHSQLYGKQETINSLNKNNELLKTQIITLNNTVQSKSEIIRNYSNQINIFQHSFTFKLNTLLNLLLLVFHPSKLISHLKLSRNHKRNIHVIKKSSYFDINYYLENNPDVTQSGINPIVHYLLNGGFEGRNPSELFDSSYYLESNPDVKEAGVNPLLHYIQNGRYEGRNIKKVNNYIENIEEHSKISEDEKAIRIIAESGLFNESYYLQNYPDVRKSELTPIEHYYYHGCKEDRNPSPEFEADFYKHQNPEVFSKGINPLLHFLMNENKQQTLSSNSKKVFKKKKQPRQIKHPNNSFITPDKNKVWLWMKFMQICIKSPINTLKHINLKNLKILFKALKNEDSKTILKSLKNLLSENQKEYLSDLTSINHYKPYHKNENTEEWPVKLIAFYLPQFHVIAENDKWWGNGFTEWSNVRPSKPQFKGHHQPDVPGDLGYYNLLDLKTMSRQIDMAKNYGVDGFCFHYYWFNGTRLLEKPIENYLNNHDLNLPFCLSWANENWTRRWDGNDRDILMEQHHTPEDDIEFIKHISKYLIDPRYIRIEDKPLLLVYRPGLLPSAKETATRWRKWCRENNIGEIYLAYVQSFEKPNPYDLGYDAAVEFPPNNFGPSKISNKLIPCNQEFNGLIYDWKSMLDDSEHYSTPNYTLFRGVCPSWDNTPRRKNESTIFINDNPIDFQKWVYNASSDTIKRFKKKDERLIFINAWNEWAEGAYLEPDKRNGYAYLAAIYNALVDLNHDFSNKKNICDTYSIHTSIYSDRSRIVKDIFNIKQIPTRFKFLIDYTKFLTLIDGMYPKSFSFRDDEPVLCIKKQIYRIANRKSLFNIFENTINNISDDIISFVILQYNNVEYTIECIKSIKNIKDKRIRIVVVDNASTEKNKDILKKLYQDDSSVILIFNKTNLGFAAGNNVGYRYSRIILNAKFIAIINNDTVITQLDFIERLLLIFKEWSYSLLGPDILIPDGRHENPYNDNIYDTQECLELIKLRKGEKENLIQTGVVHFKEVRKSSSDKEFVINPILQGAAIIYSPIYIIDNEFAFEELTFLYGEEFVLSSNSLVNGELLLYSNNIKILHKEGVSTNGLEFKNKMIFGYENAIKSLERSINILNEHSSTEDQFKLCIIDTNLINEKIDTNKHNVLFDLFFCQGGFHGGGEYGKAVFKKLSESIYINNECELWIAADPTLFVDDWIWDRCKKWKIKIIPIKNYKSIVQLVNMDLFDVFFAPAIVVYSEGYEYMQKIGNGVSLKSKKTKVIGTLHDIRDFELAYNIDKLIPHFKNLKCLPEDNFNCNELEKQIKLKKKEAEDLLNMYTQLCNSTSINTIITVSEYSRESILSNVSKCENKLKVLYAPIKHRSKIRPFNIEEKGFNIKNYALIVNASRKEKNTAAVLKAFDNLFSKKNLSKIIPPNFCVVLTGIRNVQEIVNGNLKNASRFIFLPYLPAANLEYLYKNTKLLVFMSLNEGFGYPPIEVMSYGKTCVVSNVTSIPEICEESAIYCDPYNIQSIEDGIMKAFSEGISSDIINDQYQKVTERQKSDLEKLVNILMKKEE